MIKTFSLILDLLKVCLCVKLESSVLQDLLCKSAWLDRSRISRSIEAHADCFSAEFFNSAQALLTCRVLCFILSIKGKILTTF